MNTGFDSPSGRMDTIPSSLTGGMLRYFTPYPLSQLLECCKALSADIVPTNVASAGSLPLLISGPLSFRGGRFDQRQSAVLVDIALGGFRVQTLPDLLQIGRRLGIRVPELRKEMVYADAPVPSMASVIFAHHEEVPTLMNSLLLEFGEGECRVHPYLAAIVAGFFCVHVHPFLDGNGRWSRVVAAAMGKSPQAQAETYLAALFMSSCKEELARSVWATVRASGFRECFERAICFRSAFFEEIPDCIAGDTEKILSTISGFPGTRAARLQLLAAIYAKGEVDAENMRDAFNISRKVASGRISELARRSVSYSGEDGAVSVRSPWRAILEASERARMKAMEYFNP